MKRWKANPRPLVGVSYRMTDSDEPVQLLVVPTGFRDMYAVISDSAYDTTRDNTHMMDSKQLKDSYGINILEDLEVNRMSVEDANKLAKKISILSTKAKAADSIVNALEVIKKTEGFADETSDREVEGEQKSPNGFL